MTIAGSKHGACGSINDLCGFDIPIVQKWCDIGEQKITGTRLYSDILSTSPHPIQIEIGIGNTCGLNCQHCFLGYKGGEMQSDLIPMPRLFEIVDESINKLQTRIICVTDRDALLPPERSIPFFEHLAAHRSRNRNIKFGGVTNGLTIHNHLDNLARIKPDYLDISMEGLEKEHDFIRGAGTFNKVISNLRLALKHQVAKRITISTTLSRFNMDSAIGLIKKLSVEEGVQWFDISPLMAAKMQSYQLGATDCVLFLNNLKMALEPVNINQNVTVLFELCAACNVFLPALIDCGWLNPNELRQDSDGRLYQNIKVNDSITLVLRPELIPEYWRHSLRITADGYVVGGCEPLSQSDYHDLAIGNVKEESVPSVYERALSFGSPFHQMMLAYDRSGCRGKECFRHCLGGDALLSKSIYNDYNRKDINCNWTEYRYVNSYKEVA